MKIKKVDGRALAHFIKHKVYYVSDYTFDEGYETMIFEVKSNPEMANVDWNWGVHWLGVERRGEE